jgi:hypothetical protein
LLAIANLRLQGAQGLQSPIAQADQGFLNASDLYTTNQAQRLGYLNTANDVNNAMNARILQNLQTASNLDYVQRAALQLDAVNTTLIS